MAYTTPQIRDVRRLRNDGKWKSAASLLRRIDPEQHTQTAYLNEVVRTRVAELNEKGAEDVTCVYDTLAEIIDRSMATPDTQT